mmetsp:Transcript_21063/g.47746  ORF Transcript_21063/g.47746 Transcript_21063/m.47746 type:complete len:213 (-) Transcript_21063:875-1513(-)
MGRQLLLRLGRHSQRSGSLDVLHGPVLQDPSVRQNRTTARTPEAKRPETGRTGRSVVRGISQRNVQPAMHRRRPQRARRLLQLLRFPLLAPLGDRTPKTPYRGVFPRPCQGGLYLDVGRRRPAAAVHDPVAPGQLLLRRGRCSATVRGVGRVQAGRRRWKPGVADDEYGRGDGHVHDAAICGVESPALFREKGSGAPGDDSPPTHDAAIETR